MMKFCVLSLLSACFETAVALKDNNVYFVNSGSVDYELATHTISSRRRSTWGGVYNEFDHLNVQTSSIGAKHTEQSDFFLEGLGPANVVGSNGKSQFPSQLYFAMTGDLSMNVDGVTVTCDDIRLGKATKWWLAGPNCYGGNSGKDPVTCECRDGALVKFASKSSSNNNKFKVSLETKCGLIAARLGSWSPVTALAGQKISYHYEAASSTYTKEDFQYSLTAKYSNAFTFGKLEMSAEASMQFVTETTRSESYSQTCEVTVPENTRLWQWTYSVTNACGTSKEFLCYFKDLPINDGAPCCLVGYQSNVSTVCTEPGKNMCDGTRRLSPVMV